MSDRKARVDLKLLLQKLKMKSVKDDMELTIHALMRALEAGSMYTGVESALEVEALDKVLEGMNSWK